MSSALKTIFMGTAPIAINSLQSLWEREGLQVELVVSSPDRPAGRGQKIKTPPVILWAKENACAYHQSANINDDLPLWERLQDLHPDLIIVFAFGQFLGKKFLGLPSLGAFNIHPSLLPKYRGAAPIVHTILNGERETGVTIQRMVSKMDAGDIAHAKKISLSGQETGEELTKRLGLLACETLQEFIIKFRQGTITYKPQREDEVSFAPVLRREDGRIDFHTQGIDRIQRMIRAFSPWPGVYTILSGQRLKVFEVQEVPSTVPSGIIDPKATGLVVGCLGGALRMKVVQLEGRRRCSDEEFLRGLKNPSVRLEISDA